MTIKTAVAPENTGVGFGKMKLKLNNTKKLTELYYPKKKSKMLKSEIEEQNP